MITYNHEKYISEAIEGVLMQKCSFPFQLVIGEDCSTDATASIIKEFEKKYNNLIKARYNGENIGMQNNALKTFQECEGKYIAICEGDDYWTDPLKLQKQVDFLEEHLEFVGTSHNVNYLNDPDNEVNINKEYYGENTNSIYTIKDVINGYCVAGAVCSFVFRNFFTVELIDKMKSPDFPKMNHIELSIWLALQGDIYYFKNVMATHRYIMKKGSSNWKSQSISTNQLGTLYDLFIRLEKAAYAEFGVNINLHKSKYAHFYQMLKRAFKSFRYSDIKILMDTWKKSGYMTRYFFLIFYSIAVDVSRPIRKTIKSHLNNHKMMKN